MNKWKEILLEDACDILTCGVASTPKYVDEKEGVPFLSAQNVKDGQINLEKYNYVSKDFHEHLTKKNKPRKGDILYSRVGAKYGEAAIVDFDFEFSVYVSLTLIRPKSEIFNNEFFKYYLNSPIVKQKAKKSIKSSGVPNLNVKDVRGFNIPIPPLEEQQTIVAKLDQAFAAIDQAKANIEKNIANAKELFQSKLNQIFSQNGDGWVEKTLEKTFKLKSGDGLTSKMMIQDGEYPVYGGNNIAGYYDKFNFEHGVIVGRVGALCGNARFINEKVWITDNAFKLTEFKYEFDFKFLSYLLNFKNLRSYARQAAQPVISNSSLKDVILNFPNSIETQQQIVNQLDQLQEQTNLLVTKYQQKLANLEELKKSILEKAFKGELSTAAIEKV